MATYSLPHSDSGCCSEGVLNCPDNECGDCGTYNPCIQYTVTETAPPLPYSAINVYREVQMGNFWADKAITIIDWDGNQAEVYGRLLEGYIFNVDSNGELTEEDSDQWSCCPDSGFTFTGGNPWPSTKRYRSIREYKYKYSNRSGGPGNGVLNNFDADWQEATNLITESNKDNCGSDEPADHYNSLIWNGMVVWQEEIPSFMRGGLIYEIIPV